MGDDPKDETPNPFKIQLQPAVGTQAPYMFVCVCVCACGGGVMRSLCHHDYIEWAEGHVPLHLQLVSKSCDLLLQRPRPLQMHGPHTMLTTTIDR